MATDALIPTVCRACNGNFPTCKEACAKSAGKRSYPSQPALTGPNFHLNTPGGGPMTGQWPGLAEQRVPYDG